MSVKQGVVKEIKQKGPFVGKYGYSDSTNLAKGFPSSPIHTDDITDQSRTDDYVKILNETNENKNSDFPEGVDMNYSEAPSYKEVASNLLGGLLGYPASPFVPNPSVAPSEVAHNPLFKAAPPDDFRKDGGPHKQFGSVTSQGTDLSPDKSAKKISTTDFTDLEFGKISD